ncbi:MAG: DNA polymerase III subunit delta [Candidatus Puniceispirillaceae bacterium]
MKIPPRDITRTLSQPSPTYLGYFFHGADIGLMRERALSLAKKIVSDIDDPFQSVSLRGEEVKTDPIRLVDEVTALPVFGDERLVRLRGTGAEITDAVKQAAPYLRPGTRLIIEASDTTTKHAIVKFCDQHDQIASIGCYADEDKDIAQLAQSVFAADNISLDKQAMALLVSRLGGDRLASRSELEKLALYAGPKGTLSADDIEQALGDSSAQAIDIFMKSVLTGNVELLGTMMDKARQEEIAPIAIMRQLAASMRQIYEIRALMAQGESASSAAARLRPPVHFKSKPLIIATAGRMTGSQALGFWQRLTQMEQELKSGTISEPYTHLGQGLLGLCLRLRSK